MVPKEETSMSQMALNIGTTSGTSNLTTVPLDELSKGSSGFHVFSIDENRAKDAADKLNRSKQRRQQEQNFAYTEEN